MSCSLIGSTARALLCMADAELRIQVMVEAAVAIMSLNTVTCSRLVKR